MGGMNLVRDRDEHLGTRSEMGQLTRRRSRGPCQNLWRLSTCLCWQHWVGSREQEQVQVQVQVGLWEWVGLAGT